VIRRRTSVFVIACALLAAACNQSAGPAAVAGEPIADLPDYPGATRTQYSAAGPKDGFSRVVKAEYFTGDTYDAVKAHYQSAISSNGWQVTKNAEKAGEAEWTLSKGTSVAEVEVEAKKTGGVEVKVERKDR
jgi:hypothetical protein